MAIAQRTVRSFQKGWTCTRGQQICPFELFPVFNMAKGGGLILIVFFHLCVRVCVASTVATTSETKMIIYYMYSYNLLLFSLLPSCWLSREGTYMPAAGPFIIYIVRVRFRFLGFWFLSEGRLRANGDCSTSFSCCFSTRVRDNQQGV